MPTAQDDDKITQGLIAVINKLIIAVLVLVVGIIAIPVALYYRDRPAQAKEKTTGVDKESNDETALYWMAPDINAVTDPVQKSKIEYGKELIAHTAKYLGPKGTVLKMSNGMNCQNCHLEAGTKVWGNNYGSVFSLYPKFRARSGSIENIYKRVNDCFERSLNGKALDTAGKEMQSIVAYINFLGANVPKGKKAEGSGFKDLGFLDRAAETEKGRLVYIAKCQSCHQTNGEGVLAADQIEYTYPALWGNNSYNDGAGLYRIINFAKYVKYNMPQGTSYQHPQLMDEEAWDVAAFVNTQLRPHIDVPRDWPDKSKKPIDHPFGPYTDNFTEIQHKYGPFKLMADEQKKRDELAKIAKEKETAKK